MEIRMHENSIVEVIAMGEEDLAQLMLEEIDSKETKILFTDTTSFNLLNNSMSGFFEVVELKRPVSCHLARAVLYSSYFIVNKLKVPVEIYTYEESWEVKELCEILSSDFIESFSWLNNAATYIPSLVSKHTQIFNSSVSHYVEENESDCMLTLKNIVADVESNTFLKVKKFFYMENSSNSYSSLNSLELLIKFWRHIYVMDVVSAKKIGIEKIYNVVNVSMRSCLLGKFNINYESDKWFMLLALQTALFVRLAVSYYQAERYNESVMSLVRSVESSASSLLLATGIAEFSNKNGKLVASGKSFKGAGDLLRLVLDSGCNSMNATQKQSINDLYKVLNIRNENKLTHGFLDAGSKDFEFCYKRTVKGVKEMLKQAGVENIYLSSFEELCFSKALNVFSENIKSGVIDFYLQKKS